MFTFRGHPILQLSGLSARISDVRSIRRHLPHLTTRSIHHRARIVALGEVSNIIGRVPTSCVSIDKPYIFGSGAWRTLSSHSPSEKPPGSREEDKQHENQEEDESIAEQRVGRKTILSRARAMRSNVRERAREMGSNVRERAVEMRDNARDQYREFREHPGESAIKGSKNIGAMLRQYGPVFVGTYFVVYMSTLGSLFLGVQSGILDPVVLFGWFGHADAGETKNTVQLVVDFMNDHTITKPYAEVVEKNPAMANLAVAWIAVKFTEPFRLPTALALTPRVARVLGWQVKPSSSADGKS